MLRAAVLLAVSSLATRVAAAPARRETLLYANCPRESGEYTGTLRGRIRLARAFLDPALSEEEAIRGSVEQQIKYLWGHYRNDADAHAALQLVLSAEAPDVRVLSRREVPYGRDLALPWHAANPHLAIDDIYTRRAVAAGRVRVADPALDVEYQIRFKLAICGRGADPGARLRVPLPPDPWLAYWYVPAARHRPLRYHQDRAVTNPCADDDFADLPHPFYYWYDYLPTRHGPDDDGHAFDCRRWLHAGTDYDAFDVALERTGTASHDLAHLRRELSAGGDAPLQATVLVGIIDHTVTEPVLAPWRELIGDGGPGALAERAAAARRRWSDDATREKGTGSFLQALDELAQVMTFDGHSSVVDGGFLRVEARGHLKRSGRALRVRCYLGLTDLFGPRPPAHWAVLRRALAEDHLIIYWGHSGIGENFRLAQIERNSGIEHAQLATETARSPLRLVAILSCYSYMYFGQDLLEAGAARSGGGFFVFTGMEASQHEAGPLGVFDLVDRVLSPDNPTGRIERMPPLVDDEFWLIKEVGGG